MTPRVVFVLVVLLVCVLACGGSAEQEIMNIIIAKTLALVLRHSSSVTGHNLHCSEIGISPSAAGASAPRLGN